MRSPLHRHVLFFVAATSLCALAPAQWHQWRGPTGDGHAPQQPAALQWGADQNIKWRTPLTQPGNGSPIVCGDRVFLTMPEDSEGKGRSLYCFARASGEQLWVQTVEFDEAMPTHNTNPHCSTTPACDGERVVVWHASAGLHCYTVEGKPLWQRNLGEFRHQWGHGTSPMLHNGRIILQSGPGERSFVGAYNLATGETVWETEEPSFLTEEQIEKKRLAGSWCTPLIHSVGDRDLVLCGQPTRIVAYDAEDGAIVWSCAGVSSERGDLTYSSPVVADGVCMIMGGYVGPSIGVRIDGKGDVTESHRVWRKPSQMSNCASGVYAGGAVFILDMGGFLSCIDPATGDTHWKKRLGRGNSWGSIVEVNDQLYAMLQDGTTYVFEPNSEELVLLATNALNETTNSTPAFADGEIFLRTHESLYCVAADK